MARVATSDQGYGFPDNDLWGGQFQLGKKGRIYSNKSALHPLWLVWLRLMGLALVGLALHAAADDWWPIKPNDISTHRDSICTYRHIHKQRDEE